MEMKNEKFAFTKTLILQLRALILPLILLIIPVYAKLFNIILSTGIVPDDWAISIIRPIYKNRGDDTDPNNYRGISLLSCFGKLFTSCLNERLSNFVKAHDTVGPEQAGFKSDNSTIDHIFVLKTSAVFTSTNVSDYTVVF